LGHIEYASAIAKSRIDPELIRQAEADLEEIGLKPRVALELFTNRSLSAEQFLSLSRQTARKMTF